MRLLSSLQRHEIEWLQRWQSHSHSLSIAVAKLMSKSADGYPYIVATLFVAWQQASPVWILVVATAFILERYLYFICKNNFRRHRPPVVIQDYRSFIIPSDQFSLPSGHTSGAFLFATLLCPWYPALGFLLYLWATSVGISRVILGVHFPTDTALGACLGTSIALLINGVWL